MSELDVGELEGLGVDIRVVDVDKIHPNDYNPNEMDSALFDSLVEAIHLDGKMNQPVLVRPHAKLEGEFTIVDGENRYMAAKLADMEKIVVVVVDYDDNMAKLRTLSYNAIKGQNVPIKLAHLLVDLQKTYSEAEIRAMTGIHEEAQQDAMSLLKVPEVTPTEPIPSEAVSKPSDAPVQVTLVLSKSEHIEYSHAMQLAMAMAGDEAVALVGEEVKDYEKAIRGAMGLAGVKLRNVGMVALCRAFNEVLTDEQRAQICQEVGQEAVRKNAESSPTAKRRKTRASREEAATAD